MKLNEIAVYHTPEYELSTKDQQNYAFLARAPDLKPEEILDMYGAELYSFDVKLNTGESFTVKPEFNTYRTIDIPNVKMIQFKDIKNDENGKYDTYYMVSGSRPNQKNAVFFRKKDVEKQLTEMRQAYLEALKEYHANFQKKLQYELRDKLTPAAREALNDNILELVNNKDHEGLYRWFKSHGFTMGENGEIPSPEEFKKMTSLFGWNVKTDNRYRAAQGVAMKIDWEKKQFYTMGWSSDD